MLIALEGQIENTCDMQGIRIDTGAKDLRHRGQIQ